MACSWLAEGRIWLIGDSLEFLDGTQTFLPYRKHKKQRPGVSQAGVLLREIGNGCFILLYSSPLNSLSMPDTGVNPYLPTPAPHCVVQKLETPLFRETRCESKYSRLGIETLATLDSGRYCFQAQISGLSPGLLQHTLNGSKQRERKEGSPPIPQSRWMSSSLAQINFLKGISAW